MQRELIKNLELLYAVFASATTMKGIKATQSRYRAIGLRRPILRHPESR